MSTTSHHSSGGVSLGAIAAPSTDRSRSAQPEHTAAARKAFIQALGVAAQEVDGELQTRAKSIHSNAHALTKQEKELQEQTKKMAKENAAAEKFLEKSQKKMAEFDDLADLEFDNEGLENDLEDIEALLDFMEGKTKPGGKSSNSTTKEDENGAEVR